MPQSSGSSGRGDVKWPDLDTWVEPGRPDRDPGWPPGPAASRPRPARVSRLALLAVALLGLALGAGIALAVTYRPAGQASAAGVVISPSAPAAPSSAPSAVTPSSAPSVVVPSQGSGGLAPGSGGALPGGAGALPGGGGGGPGGQMLFLGQVTALSKSSITLSAEGHTVTAELTGATRITGRLKVGDTVSAQITAVAGGRYAVSAIQDPPSLP
jgi:hypothetical protein